MATCLQAEGRAANDHAVYFKPIYDNASMYMPTYRNHVRFCGVITHKHHNHVSEHPGKLIRMLAVVVAAKALEV
jgi:hypothetical protein